MLKANLILPTPKLQLTTISEAKSKRYRYFEELLHSGQKVRR